MPSRINPQAAEQAARRLLDDRITAVRNLALARQNRDDKRAELAGAERDDAAAYAAAQRAGWTADELRKVGFSEPAVRRPGRPRRREKRSPDVAGTDSTQGHRPAV